MRTAWAALLLSIPIAAQPPGIRQNGVVNSASQVPPTLAGGAIARGALFTIFGVRLGTIGQTTVTVSGAAATVINANPTRAEAVMPQSAPLGSAPLVVTVNGLASKPFAI